MRLILSVLCLALSACLGTVGTTPPTDDETITVDVTVTGTSTGRITSTPAGIDCPTNCSATFPSGMNVTLVAAPDSGAAFAEFSGACSGLDKTCTFTADADATVDATFARSGEKRFVTKIEGAFVGTIAADADGNVLVAGTLVEGGGMYLSLRSGRDGSVIWERTYAGLTGAKIAYTTTGEIVLSAPYIGNPTFGGRILPNRGSNDFLVAKLSATGDPVWSKEFGGDRADTSLGLAVAPNGTIFVGGTFTSTSLTMGSTTLALSTTTSPFLADAFIAALGNDGVVQWAHRYGSVSGAEDVQGVTVDAQGAPLITGHFYNSVSFGTGFNYTSADLGADAYALQLRTTDGAPQWGRRIGATGFDLGYDVSHASDGATIVTGVITNAQSFGGPMLPSSGGLDIFVAAYKSGGLHAWSATFGSAANDSATEVVVDSTGAVMLIGYSASSLDFGGGMLANAGGQDGFVVKLAPGGAHVWSHMFGGSLDDFARDVAVDHRDNLYVAGSFRGTANIADATLSTTATAASYLVGFWP